MSPLPPLEALGRRIIVLGPTNSGKSTLTEALARRLDIPSVHLDQFRHLPGTDWQQRPDADFARLHDTAMAMDAWVMDGSYSRLMPQRVARATGIIVLDAVLPVRVLRYLRRTLLQKRRAGGLEGARETVKWQMLVWLWVTRNKSEEARRFAMSTGLPFVLANNRPALEALYAGWGLSRV
jgi:adenylate kinase family enzyme